MLAWAASPAQLGLKHVNEWFAGLLCSPGPQPKSPAHLGIALGEARGLGATEEVRGGRRAVGTPNRKFGVVMNALRGSFNKVFFQGFSEMVTSS